MITKKRKYNTSLFDAAALPAALNDVKCRAIIREIAKRDLTLSHLKKILKFDSSHIKKLYAASIVIMYRSPSDDEWAYQLSTYGKDKFIDYVKERKRQ